jgi:hypothetical protein
LRLGGVVDIFFDVLKIAFGWQGPAVIIVGCFLPVLDKNYPVMQGGTRLQPDRPEEKTVG